MAQLKQDLTFGYWSAFTVVVLHSMERRFTRIGQSRRWMIQKKHGRKGTTKRRRKKETQFSHAWPFLRSSTTIEKGKERKSEEKATEN